MISFDEFLKMMAAHQKETDNEDELKEAFKVFDRVLLLVPFQITSGPVRGALEPPWRSGRCWPRIGPLTKLYFWYR